MLQIHLLQQWFTLTDPLMEEMLFDTPCFRCFAGIDMVWEQIPNETTVLNFRHLLAQHGIREQIFEVVKQMLNEQGALLTGGTIVDATIILAPSSTFRAKPECAGGDRTKGVNGTRRSIRWPRATSGIAA
jgi:IS5 family transposase